MSNALYTKGKEAILAGDVDLETDTIKAVLVDTDDYTVNLSTHDNLDDIPSGARVATATLSSKTISGGKFDASDIEWLAVSGDTVEAVVLYKDTGVESTSKLIAYYDTLSGLPYTPSGVNAKWTLDNTNGLFKL